MQYYSVLNHHFAWDMQDFTDFLFVQTEGGVLYQLKIECRLSSCKSSGLLDDCMDGFRKEVSENHSIKNVCNASV